MHVVIGKGWKRSHKMRECGRTDGNRRRIDGISEAKCVVVVVVVVVVLVVLFIPRVHHHRRAGDFPAERIIIVSRATPMRRFVRRRRRSKMSTRCRRGRGRREFGRERARVRVGWCDEHRFVCLFVCLLARVFFTCLCRIRITDCSFFCAMTCRKRRKNPSEKRNSVAGGRKSALSFRTTSDEGHINAIL